MNIHEDIQQILRRMIDTQRYAVLATNDQGQPYTSLMAFAATTDLKQIILLTERRTQKHANLQSNKRVAILIDNRENSGADTKDAIAITAIGEAEEVAADGCANLLDLYLARHPYLKEFSLLPTCAVVSVKVSSYMVVRQFQLVVEWRTGQ
jgi:heme iron utilization protein